MSRAHAAWLAALLLVYFILGALFATTTPDWQAPDEPAHYNYIRTLAETGRFPVLHMGDYPHAYLEEIKAAGFPPSMRIDAIRYESHQPPLYYALAAPVYSLSGGDLHTLRLLSVVMGAGIVLLAHRIGWRVARSPAFGLATAAFVAFLPQHLATVSQVGNDVLAELLFAAALLLLLGGARRRWLLGLLLGLILITKTTAFIALPLAAGVVVWQWVRGRAGAREILADILVVGLPMLLIALPWFARNSWAYGWPDILGLERHDAIVTGQTRTSEFLAREGLAAYARRAVEFTFKSFWGVFGWLGVFMDSRVYLLLALISSTVLAALAWIAVGGRRPLTPAPEPVRASGEGDPSAMIGGGLSSPAGPEVNPIHRVSTYDSRGFEPPAGAAAGVAPAGSPTPLRLSFSGPVHDAPPAVPLLLAVVALSLLAYGWYNLQFVQHQGRYLFPALIPIAVGFVAGWAVLSRPDASRIAAAGCAVFGALLVAWGLLTGAGLPRWPLAIAAGLGGLLLLRTLLPGRWDGAVFATPFALMPLLSLYALFGAIVPQLVR